MATTSSRRWLIIAPAIIFALFSRPAKAEEPGQWTFSKSCANSGSVEVVNDVITLHGPDGNGCSGQPHWVKIVTTIPAGINTVDFSWSYWTWDGAWYDPPQYAVNGNYVQLTMANNASGSLSIPVNEGDTFTFRQYSTDTCCQPGHLTISNLSLWVSITSSTTSTTTTTTTAPTSTVPVTNPTTTTVQETTTTESTTTTSVANLTSTTSSVPQTTTTESAPTTTQPPATLPPTPPQTTVPVSVETSAPTTLPETTTSTSTTLVKATTTTSLPPSNTTTSTSTSIPPTTTIAPESPQTTLPAVLSDVTPTEALSVALAPETLSTLTATQAEQIFASLPTEQLSDTQIAEITAAVQNAPTEVRQAFEEKVDIFKAGFDDYVPVGSNIPVGTRRTLIAVTAGITLAAVGSRIKR